MFGDLWTYVRDSWYEGVPFWKWTVRDFRMYRQEVAEWAKVCERTGVDIPFRSGNVAEEVEEAPRYRGCQGIDVESDWFGRNW